MLEEVRETSCSDGTRRIQIGDVIGPSEFQSLRTHSNDYWSVIGADVWWIWVKTADSQYRHRSRGSRSGKQKQLSHCRCFKVHIPSQVSDMSCHMYKQYLPFARIRQSVSISNGVAPHSGVSDGCSVQQLKDHTPLHSLHTHRSVRTCTDNLSLASGVSCLSVVTEQNSSNQEDYTTDQDSHR